MWLLATVTLADFVATLSDEDHAELREGLRSFADRSLAFVIGCPSAGRAEWLFVSMPFDGTAPRLGFFVGRRLTFPRQHPNVVLPAGGSR